MTPALLTIIRQHNVERHALGEVCEERAAIAEVEAWLPSIEAEALA
jgi:hypothetical protein